MGRPGRERTHRESFERRIDASTLHGIVGGEDVASQEELQSISDLLDRRLDVNVIGAPQTALLGHVRDHVNNVGLGELADQFRLDRGAEHWACDGDGKQDAEPVLALRGGAAAVLRGTRNAAHQAAVREWQGERPDPEVFRAEILPGLRHVPIAQLAAETGLSAHYCSLVRLGKKVPHPRHWDILRGLRLAGDQ